LRFFNVYGPRQDPASPYSGVISIFCDRIRAGRGVVIFGDGGQSRDFIFVGDVVRALLAAMEHTTAAAQSYNVCTGRPTTLRELVEAIGGALETTPSITYAPPRQGDIRVSCGNPSGARAALGFEARTSLAEGLVRTLPGSSHVGSIPGRLMAGVQGGEYRNGRAVG
jgi:UDP-glucose 4-epimerase